MPRWVTIDSSREKRRRHWRLERMLRCGRCNGTKRITTRAGESIVCPSCKGSGKLDAMPDPRVTHLPPKPRERKHDDDLPF